MTWILGLASYEVGMEWMDDVMSAKKSMTWHGTLSLKLNRFMMTV